MVRKTKKYIELISSYGILRLTPVREDIVRVQFRKGTQAQFEAGYWNCEPEREGFWKAKDGKFLAEITTGSIFIQADKKTGALQFLNAQKKLLLSEKAAMPRQCESTDTPETWVYFDWAKNEPLFAKGLLADEWERLNQKARYISFGGRKMRMPLLVSANGYGIGVSAEKTAMCCIYQCMEIICIPKAANRSITIFCTVKTGSRCSRCTKNSKNSIKNL